MLLAYLDFVPEVGPAVRAHETASRAIASAPGLMGTTQPRGDFFDLVEEDGGIEPDMMWTAPRTFIIDFEVWAADLEAARIEFAMVDAAMRASHHQKVLMRWQPDNPGSPHLQGYVKLISAVPPEIPWEGSWRGQAQLRAASPYWVSQTLRSSTIGAPSFTVGLETPLITPIPTGADVGAALIACQNLGNARSCPVIKITGPVIGPTVENLDTGASLSFPTLNLGAGQVLVIDTDPQASDVFTVNGDATGVSPDWETADFPRIEADETQTLKFYGLGGGYGSETAMTVEWRDTYL